MKERKRGEKGKVEIESETANLGSQPQPSADLCDCVLVCVWEYEMKNSSLWGVGKLDSEFILKTPKWPWGPCFPTKAALR